MLDVLDHELSAYLVAHVVEHGFELNLKVVKRVEHVSVFGKVFRTLCVKQLALDKPNALHLFRVWSEN